MTDPLSNLIDKSVRCALCGTKGFMTCDCYITLMCPKCKTARLVKREDHDPENTKKLVFSCPECRVDSDEPTYLDESNREIIL